MISNRGKIIGFEKKEMIVNLKAFFDKNPDIIQSNESNVQLVANALNIGEASVNRILADYNKNPDNIYKESLTRGHQPQVLDTSLQHKIRSYIRAENLAGRHITLESIKIYLLQENIDQDDFHVTTLARTLDRWGFEFGKGMRTQHLKEKDYVIAARRRYLRKMRNNRLNNSHEDIIRSEVYLDESYVNKNHSNDFTWYFSDDGPTVCKPTGQGERLVIMNAITKDGWVQGAKRIFKSSRKTGDYHGQMNGNLFKKWFEEQLLPNIPKNSIIVMDNAAYHNTLSEDSAPTKISSKKLMLRWLEKNKIPFSPDCLKAELSELVNRLAPEPTIEIDAIAEKYGHEVLRTPPYHPELQPIEICWAVVKNEVARNCDFSMKNLEIQLNHGFDKVTCNTTTKIIKKVREIEDNYWIEDNQLENEMILN